MQQVDKIKYIIIWLGIIFFISGCSFKNEYTSSSRNFDNNISKDQLLHAAKKVFLLTDKKAFRVDSYRNELQVTKEKAAYKFYTMDIQNDKFDFKITKDDKSPNLIATLSIYRTYDDENDKEYINDKSYPYELFWNRIEYILGLEKNWPLCNPLLSKGILCDIVDLENSWFEKKEILDLEINKPKIEQKTEKIKSN